MFTLSKCFLYFFGSFFLKQPSDAYREVQPLINAVDPTVVFRFETGVK